MTKLFAGFGAAIAMLFVLTLPAASFAQEEETQQEAPLIEEPSIWQSAVQTVTEVYQEYNNTAGDSQAEQIVDDTNNNSDQ